jgi:hypothetical protein
MRRAQAIALLAAMAASGCSQGEPAIQGPSEPFRVRGGRFIEADLPGEAPTDAGQPPADPDAGLSGPPSITALDLSNIVVHQGQGNKKVAGRTSPNGWAVGIRLADVGSGYWVLPTGVVDPPTGELTWEALCDFDPSIKPGFHDLRVVALSEDGQAGRQLSQPLCVTGRVPDNFNFCDPSSPPPEAVISLTWDTNVDLDLQVVAPDGRVTDPKHPATHDSDDAGVIPPEAGMIDRDSNANCVIDGIRYENLVWQSVAPKGRYGIYANLFDSCNQGPVRFEASVYTAVDNGDGSKVLKQWYAASGELLDFQANGGEARGLFLYEFDFQ